MSSSLPEIMSSIITIPDKAKSLHTAVGRNEAIYKTFTFHGIRIWNYVSTKVSVDVSYDSIYICFIYNNNNTVLNILRNYLSKIIQFHME